MNAESRTVWVLDASVLINLLASGRMREVLEAIPASWCVTAQAADEVARDPLDSSNNVPISPYVQAGTLSIVELHGASLETFVALVSAQGSDSLGDGEAATLAHAYHVGGMAIIDEKKARGVGAKQFASVPVLSTVDLYRHPKVLEALGERAVAQLVLSSLRFARMRVSPEHDEWVRNAIGHDEARNCSSLKQR